MLYVVVGFLGASLGLSLLVIVWGITWALRPQVKVEKRSVFPRVDIRA
jgi:hypothetical protein